jgi:dienelactone hydrolase
MINERLVQYEHKGTLLEGFLAYDDSNPVPGPAVMISHAWAGRDEFACDKARVMASLGYTGFALDLYGKDVRGSGPEENSRLMQPFLQDRAMLQSRMQASLETLLTMPEVRPDRVAAMGFCFGGLCVLDLARTGADLCGVISVHGFFSPPATTQARPVKAKILALHGHDDPMVSMETAVAFGKEMTAGGVDFQLHVFGNTQHAFTNPQADDHGRGTVYNKLADSRSWKMIGDFLKEVLGQ